MTVILYGPLEVAGAHRADINARFDTSLRLKSSGWGLRDLDDVAALAHGLSLAETRPCRQTA